MELDTMNNTRYGISNIPLNTRALTDIPAVQMLIKFLYVGSSAPGLYIKNGIQQELELIKHVTVLYLQNFSHIN